ncbi:cysteine desulfurase family protein [Psychroflexus planctonicus]|uniref:cysteine desulfurase n=1 Tax=Psychroflexus planctonicus TaxID=1526575 RepID=A0ABQ1SHF2_9FLAO|nr:cysteine desulfurase family protein [Psychroflexus planctonicus]GGE39605.1 cysteine desulfurase [Psychroflexus planctonicus]
MKQVYLDNAATTCLRTEVIDIITDTLQNCYGNPSSTHAFGRSAKSKIEQARKSIAKLLHVSAAEIVFTSGGTEADNLVIHNAVRDLDVGRIITSKIEHHAVLNAVEFLEKQHQVHVDYVDLDENGDVNLKHLEDLLQNSASKTLVSLMHINNEIGNILPLQKVAILCKANDALFHSDTVQSIGHFDLNLQETPIDFLAASAHKFHGPKGVGFAFIRKGLPIKALIHGGAQERGFRAGTENVHNIVGMEKALEMAYSNLSVEKNTILNLKHYFIEELKKHIPEVQFNGQSSNTEKSTYTLVNVSIPVKPEQAALMLFQLDLKGIACSKGSACQSGSDQGSFVLNEIYDIERLKNPNLRFSFSHYTTKAELDYVVETLVTFAKTGKLAKA